MGATKPHARTGFCEPCWHTAWWRANYEDTSKDQTAHYNEVLAEHTPPPVMDETFKPPKELCPHPADSLVQMGQEVCDPDLVTVCTRCGTAFPGKTAQDLLAA